MNVSYAKTLFFFLGGGGSIESIVKCGIKKDAIHVDNKSYPCRADPDCSGGLGWGMDPQQH